MSVSRLKNGRWRAQVYAPGGKTISAAKVLGLPPGEATFSSKRKAEDAVTEARKVLAARTGSETTIAEWAHVWTTDPFWSRPKESTDIKYRRRIRGVVERYGHLSLSAFGDKEVAEVMRGSVTVQQTVRVFFRDAMTRRAGRLLDVDPFRGERYQASKGKGHVDPPGQEVVWALVEAARELVNPGFAAWLQTAAFTGLRPGELDGLRWVNVDFGRGRIRVVEQFNATSNGFTSPKNGRVREALLTPFAREALEGLHRRGEFCFTNLRDEHWRESARRKHWRRRDKKTGELLGVAAEVGYTGTLYMATRHFAGGFMVNELGLPDSVVAIALGHEDGGKLVRTTYGHRDKDRVLAEAQRAYESVGNVVALRPVVPARAEVSHDASS